jgi:hypothetical protein
MVAESTIVSGGCEATLATTVQLGDVVEGTHPDSLMETTRAGLLLMFLGNVIDKLVGLHIEGVCQLDDHVKRGDLQATFDDPNRVAVQVGFLG